jgi:hypothetical protein
MSTMSPAPARYTFVVGGTLASLASPPAGAAWGTIRRARSRPEEGALAQIVLPPGTPGPSGRTRPPFAVYGVPDGALLCDVRPAGPAGGSAYEVYAADGSPLARITRRGARLLPWPRRVRWSVETTYAPGQPFHGKVGPGYTWFFYLLLAPVWFPLWLVLLIYSFIGSLIDSGSDEDFGLNGPTRTRWRAASGAAMDHRALTYDLDPGRLDHRVAYAQAVLHHWDR